MTSYDKVVKLACKPKAAAPKAKYLDPIIAATWSEDGAVHDVCKALSPRFREPNVVVVFKALIVLHTMIRNGATDNILAYLSSSDVLRLQNVSSGNWEGYNAPENIQNYAKYLESRIRAYRDLKHDAVRVQSESNRDMRNSMIIEDDPYATARAKGKNAGGGGTGGNQGVQRSKTLAGRKLRVMTVDKGLLRETKAVHRMIDALVECRFYLDDLEDELTTTALRMLVKDLLILFQAGNEGVINVLEHYFEMSHTDATQALAIYRHFCNQTDRAVEYLGVAKKLQNLLNVPIPNLKHAPVSLAGALQEYLDDPNFEQNRLEYKTNKAAADGTNRNGRARPKKADTPQKSPSTPNPPDKPGESSSPPVVPTINNGAMDFFSAIEDELNGGQQNTQTNGASFQQQQPNPFSAMTGAQFFTQQQPSFNPQVQAQPTGFIMPQQTAFQQQQAPPNPFAFQQQQQQQQQQQPSHRPFSSFLQPQQTGFLHPQVTAVPNMFLSPSSAPPLPNAGGLLQPQATGVNPFRQSMMMPQSTGMGASLFGVGGGGMGMGGAQQGLSPFGSNAFGQSPSAPASTMHTPTAVISPFAQAQQPSTSTGFVPPARPASTPLTAFGASSNNAYMMAQGNPQGRSASPPMAQPVKTHQTGTNNPFGPVIVPPPPVPKAPTLMEIAMGFGPNNNANGMNGLGHSSLTQPQTNGQSANTTQNQPSFMGSVASEFSFGSSSQPAAKPIIPDKTGFAAFEAAQNAKLNAQNTATTSTGSMFSNPDSLFGSSGSAPSLSTQPTGATVTSSSGFSAFSAGAPSLSAVGGSATGAGANGIGLGHSPLKPQTTGFSGIKAFKPSSSFGASLIDSLPPVPTSTSGATNNANTASSNTGGLNGVGSAAPAPSFGQTNFSSPQPSNGAPNFMSQAVNFGGRSASASISGTGTGSTLGVGLRPQMTGGGTANPFRASTMGLDGSAPPPMPQNNMFTGMQTGNFGNSGSVPSFGSQMFGVGGFGGGGGGGNFGGGAFGTGGQGGGQQQQQQQQPSLI